MSLFKPLRGSRTTLGAQPLHDGYAYFCTDDGSFHIDYTDADGNLQRKQISAKDAETIMGKSLDEIKEEVTIQSDWNQTDETKPDYIKNKPKIGGVFTTSVANNILILEQTGAIYATTIENNILTLI